MKLLVSNFLVNFYPSLYAQTAALPTAELRLPVAFQRSVCFLHFCWNYWCVSRSIANRVMSVPVQKSTKTEW